MVRIFDYHPKFVLVLSGNQYFLDKIVAKDVDPDGNTEYLCTWSEYDSGGSTWQLERDITTKSLIEEFEQDYAIPDLRQIRSSKQW